MLTSPDAAPSATTTAAVLRARGLTKSYGMGEGRVRVLDGVDLDVRPGELLVVRGASGSGKSTLLHCLAGIAVPDEGEVVHVDAAGEVVLSAAGDDARTDVRARCMGLVFQSLNLIPALTAEENVQLPLVLAGVAATDIRSRAQAALDAVGLGERATAYPSTLSGGEQQRVAVARALITDPQVVLADEPTGALDSESEQVVLALLRNAVAPDRAVVVVSHADAVADVADRVVHVRDGRLA